jgi:hypothetical protein
MAAKEMLGVAVRMFGLLLAAYGIYNWFFAIIVTVGLLGTQGLIQMRDSVLYPAAMYALTGSLFIIACFVILLCADRIVDFTYRSR